MDLEIAVQRLPARAPGRPALSVETVGEVGDGLLQGRRDGVEVPLISGDQRGIRLGVKVLRECKSAL